MANEKGYHTDGTTLYFGKDADLSVNFESAQDCDQPEWRQKIAQGLVRSLVFGGGIEFIPDSSFCGLKNIESVTFPNTLKVIGDYAFSDCVNITNIELPDSVEYIGAYAFNRTGIEDIQLPSCLNYVGDYAFSECYHLKKAVIHGTHVIPRGCFQECDEMSCVEIESGVQDIGSFAFSNTALRRVRLPDTVIKLGHNFIDDGVELLAPETVRCILAKQKLG